MPPILANGKVAYLEIPAIDIERSAKFYAKVFGWRIKKREDGSTAFDDPTGEVSEPGWSDGRRLPNLAVLIFIVVDNVAATVDAIIQEGGAIVRSIARRNA